MADIINLRAARKAKARASAAATATANRAAHGRSKAERMRDASEQARHEALLDGAALVVSDPADALPPRDGA